jgi:FkbM family methyltransferase
MLLRGKQMVLTKIGRKIARLTQMIENPKLFRLRQKGIPIDNFCLLNQSWIINANINTVFDVGGNIGEFASLIHELRPAAAIYSFEPLNECFEQLRKRMGKVEKFKAFNLALADFNGELTFHRNEHLPSSSPLIMDDLHKQNYPHTTKDSVIKVRSAKLDDTANDLKIEDNLLIKIDVQGFEDKVIAGGKNTINRAKVLILETSFQTLYKGQPLFEDIYNSLKTEFMYMGALGNVRKSQIDGSPLFEDSIFVKKSSNVFI